MSRFPRRSGPCRTAPSSATAKTSAKTTPDWAAIGAGNPASCPSPTSRCEEWSPAPPTPLRSSTPRRRIYSPRRRLPRSCRSGETGSTRTRASSAAGASSAIADRGGSAAAASQNLRPSQHRQRLPRARHGLRQNNARRSRCCRADGCPPAREDQSSVSAQAERHQRTGPVRAMQRRQGIPLCGNHREVDRPPDAIRDRFRRQPLPAPARGIARGGEGTEPSSSVSGQ